jgi:hypothetical protein
MCTNEESGGKCEGKKIRLKRKGRKRGRAKIISAWYKWPCLDQTQTLVLCHEPTHVIWVKTNMRKR